MMKSIEINGKTIQYELEYKKVRNVNLRIKSDGSIYVSASKRVGLGFIEEFLVSKADFIFRALEKYKTMDDIPQKQYFSEDEICEVILELCRKAYPYFEKRGIQYPKIKFRKMVSRWGSCNATRGTLNFNTNLMYAPIECIGYVVLHEFTHFLQANHSDKFYEELAKVCPEWKKCREKLKYISIRNMD